MTTHTRSGKSEETSASNRFPPYSCALVYPGRRFLLPFVTLVPFPLSPRAGSRVRKARVTPDVSRQGARHTRNCPPLRSGVPPPPATHPLPPVRLPPIPPNDDRVREGVGGGRGGRGAMRVLIASGVLGAATS